MKIYIIDSSTGSLKKSTILFVVGIFPTSFSLIKYFATSFIVLECYSDALKFDIARYKSIVTSFFTTVS
jgi:hypothetical protein